MTAERAHLAGLLVEIELVGELERLIDEHLAQQKADNAARPTFVYTREGTPYTVDGIGAMFRAIARRPV